MNELASTGILIAGAALSALLAYRWLYLGFFLGIVIFWFSGVVRVEVLMLLDKSYEPGVGGTAWVVITGWLLGIIWCLPFSIARFFISKK
ncbi:hypothetical protein [Microbulbifer taiwanensis]|uniref:Uncharacterized protein n=3 Tax=Microbulbifer taiwanensis TaxID=986746 RepID=A0ABW1YR52_9GAMM